MMTSLVGVTGGTGAGKSAIVRAFVDRVGGTVIDLDSYYKDRSGLTPEERIGINYDEPAAFDVALLVAQVAQLARGQAVEKPVYAFATHTRVGVEVIAPAPLVVVEGLFALWWEPLRSLLDVKVFVDAPPDLRLIRRIRRDIAERGRAVDQVVHQYLATVRPMHERYVEPTRVHADLIVANDGPIADAAERVIELVRRRMTDGVAAATAGR